MGLKYMYPGSERKDADQLCMTLRAALQQSLFVHVFSCGGSNVKKYCGVRLQLISLRISENPEK